MTIEDQAPDGFRQDSSYGPELKRTLGSFQVFAISFAFISVAVGIFGTYDDVLQNAGPGRHLALGDRGGRADAGRPGGGPVRGPDRTERLVLPVGVAAGQPKIGWGFGWLTFCYLAIGVVAADSALASQAFMPLFGIGAGREHRARDHAGGAAVQAVLAIASTRVVGMINSAAVGLELMIVVVLAVALIVAVLITGNGSTDNLTSQGVAEHAPQLLRCRRRADARDDHGARPRSSASTRRPTWPRRPRTPSAPSRARSSGRWRRPACWGCCS